MKKSIMLFTAILLFASSNLYSQVSFQIGGGLGYILTVGDYGGSTVDFYNGTKYGMSSGFNYHAKARVGLLGLNLFGIIEYSTVSGEGESVPGQGEVENTNCIFSIKAGLREGKYKGVQQGGPEYETLALLGSNCLIDDPEVIIKANEMCNRYGLDTMSTGSVIAFGMETFEKGIITREDTSGIELIWGNGDALLEAVKCIGECNRDREIARHGSDESRRGFGTKRN